MNVSPETAKNWLESGAISADDYAALTKPTKAKYGAVRTEVDGIKFHSKKEARRYSELKIMEQAGEIKGLTLQQKFDLFVEDVHICFYIADFSYGDKDGCPTVEDVKGYKKGAAYQVFRIKAKLMLAIYGIRILET